MNNPLHILRTLDRHLAGSFDLYVYGRSALALGYGESAVRFQSTMDVDAILPSRDLQAIESNDDFWLAQIKTNEELGDTGLYFTHLFEDRQVILTPDWLDRVVPLPIEGLVKLRLYRPSTVDLILTKMMRVDPDDQNDIRFLMTQPDYSAGAMQSVLFRAVVPHIEEIQEAFSQNRAWLSKQIGI